MKIKYTYNQSINVAIEMKVILLYGSCHLVYKYIRYKAPIY